MDCGWWGKKGYNTWVSNYSTSESYTTTDSYEIGTVIIDPHYVPDRSWDATALAVIDNAGMKAEDLARVPSDIADAPAQQGEFKTPDCKCICHKAGISSLASKVLVFFSKLFHTNAICDCGRKHY